MTLTESAVAGHAFVPALLPTRVEQVLDTLDPRLLTLRTVSVYKKPCDQALDFALLFMAVIALTSSGFLILEYRRNSETSKDYATMSRGETVPERPKPWYYKYSKTALALSGALEFGGLLYNTSLIWISNSCSVHQPRLWGYNSVVVIIAWVV